MDNNNAVHIALASDRKYLPLAAIALCSAAENTSRELVIHFLYEDLEDSDFAVFDFLKRHPSVRFVRHQVGGTYLSDWPAMRWSHATYLRLVLPDLLPELEKIIYIDCDICVLGDLAELYDFDFDGKGVMAVAVKCRPEHVRNLGIDSGHYFNAGVLVFSPARWHRERIAERFRRCFEESADKLKYPDQDILNLVFRNDVRFLHPRWNIITSAFRNEPVAGYSTEEMIEAFRHPGIAHYTGEHKPWSRWKSFHHPFALAMRRYADLAGQKRIARVLGFKSLLFPHIAAPKKVLPWDRSVIDPALLK